jgi:hypothetical protein
MPEASQRNAARFGLSGGRMLSSDFAASAESCDGVLAGNAFGCGVSPAGAAWERAEASSDADESGIGERAGAVAAASLAAATEGRGTAGGAGSLARGAFTEVSPVNGFLYSVCGVMTSTAVGL